MPHSKKFPNKAGMVLTEALVAVSTMAMGVVALGSITTDSVSTTILSRDYLVAEGLLNEADEIVKTIRISNRMLKPADKKCWLRLVPNNSSSGDPNCDSNAEEGKNYIVFMENGIWKMEAAGGDLNLKNTQNTNYQFQVYLDSAPETFGYVSALIKPSGTEISESIFFRSVRFESKSDDDATYEVIVQWKDGSKVREMTKRVALLNYN